MGKFSDCHIDDVQLLTPTKTLQYAMSNKLAQMQKGMTLTSVKLFGFALTRLSFRFDNEVDKNGGLIARTTMTEILNGLDLKNSDWSKTAKSLKELPKTTYFKFSNDDDEWSGVMITLVHIQPKTGNVEIHFNNALSNELQELKSFFAIYDMHYTRHFTSKYSAYLYWQIVSRMNNKSKDKQVFYYSTKQLKNMFGLTKEDYCYKGHFNRTIFEKAVIDKAVAEVSFRTNIRIKWGKDMLGSRVRGYYFECTNDMCMDFETSLDDEEPLKEMLKEKIQEVSANWDDDDIQF